VLLGASQVRGQGQSVLVEGSAWVLNCDTCGASEEPIKHVLLDCTVAKLFWSITRIATGVKIPKLNESTWAHDLLQGDVCPKKDWAIILCGMWSIWMQRDK
jgi:hypothetical protein